MQNAKKNYYFEFLKDYHSIKGTCKNDELPKLLLHVCCGACSSFPLPFFVDLFDMKNSVAKITSELTLQP